MSKECKQIRDDLSAYIDGMLDETRRRSVSRHLDACPRCRHEFEGLQELVAAIGRVPSSRAPEDFARRLQRRLETESPLRRLFRRLFVPLRIKLPLELATAAALAVMIFFTIQPAGVRHKADRTSMEPVENEEKGQKVQAPPIGEALKTIPHGPSPGQRSRLSPTTAREAEKAPAFAVKEDSRPAADLGGVSQPIGLVLTLRGAGSPPQKAAGAASPAQSRNDRLASVEGQVPGPADSAADAARNGTKSAVLPRTSFAERPPDSAADRVRELVADLGGSVVDSDSRGAETAAVEYLEIEIPAGEYTAFLAGLQSLGALEGASQRVDAAAGSRVTFHLKLIARPDYRRGRD